MTRALLAAALLLGGCAYNGMYHARRLSSDAEKAERDGRTIDATAFWGQVTVKAETLLARHPDSKYSTEAKLLLGRARAHLSDCGAARPMLRATLPVLTDSADIRDASTDLARCELALGDHDAAAARLAGLAGQGSPEEQRRTRLDLARALRLAGRPLEAIAALDGVAGRDVAAERLLANASAGRVPETATLADSLIALGDSTAPWDSVLATLGRRDARAASLLLDRLTPISSARPSLHALRLLEDARRLADIDAARAEQRLAAAAETGSDQGAAATARYQLLRVSLRQVDQVAELDSFATALEGVSEAAAGGEAGKLRRMVVDVRAADSVSVTTPQGDLRLFLAAEAARDSLGASALAATLFRRVAVTWPGSPYAPKALLAAERLVPTTPDLRGLLDTLYPTSPYVARLRGEDVPELRALEDSLGAFAVAAAAERQELETPKDSLPAARPRPPTARPRPGTPGTTVVPR